MGPYLLMPRLLEETEGDLFSHLPPSERELAILEREIPFIMNDIVMMVGKPVRISWDVTIPTAGTDCVAAVSINPRFYTSGYRRVGYGVHTHECGHLLYSPWGVEFLKDCHDFGGDTMQMIGNIVLDRRDDMFNVVDHPGYADILRERMVFIATMGRRQQFGEQLDAYVNSLTSAGTGPVTTRIASKDPHILPTKEERRDQITALLRNMKPQDPYEDFLFAAKWHKRPHFYAVQRAMRLLHPTRLLAASRDEMFEICIEIHELLGEVAKTAKEREPIERRFVTLVLMMVGVERGMTLPGGPANKQLLKKIEQMMKAFLATGRGHAVRRVLRALKMSTVYPGPISVGIERSVPVKEVKSDRSFLSAYEAMLRDLRYLVDPFVARLRKIDNPSEFEIYGQDDGDLDLSEAGRIATGLGGYYMETVEERNIDAEIHLALDTSGSTSGDKLKIAKQIGVVFIEGMLTMKPDIVGHLWAYNSTAVLDLGPVSRESAILSVKSGSGNSDTHMLLAVGDALAHSRKRRKILIVVCDDGPDSIPDVKRITQLLTARGIIVIHIMVGVHATPDIYPHEILFNDMQECLESLPDLLEQLIKNLR